MKEECGMADFEIRRRANIGISSLILIFIILCLATFALLSMSNARREETLSLKNAASVQEYYLVDSQGVEFFHMVKRTLKQAKEEAPNQMQERVLEQLGTYYVAKTDTFRADIAMDAGQALRIELLPDWESAECQVLSWNVYHSEEYEIDQSVPVWTGDEGDGV